MVFAGFVILQAISDSSQIANMFNLVFPTVKDRTDKSNDQNAVEWDK